MNVLLIISSFALSLVSCSNLFEDENLHQVQVPPAETHSPSDPIPTPTENENEPLQPTRESDSDTPPQKNFYRTGQLKLDPDFQFINEKTVETGLSQWLESLPLPSAQTPFASYAPTENELTLHKNTALSFASFNLARPLTIRTLGHDIILAGDQLGTLHVDTTHPNKASGSLYVFTEHESEPTFRVEGASGEAGRDGDCSAHLERCIPISDHSTRIETPQPTVEWKEVTLRRMVSWNDNLLSEPFRQQFLSSLQRFHRNYTASDLCMTSEYGQLSEQKREYSGEIEFIQTIRIPVSFKHSQSGDERDAKLFAGTQGSDGQNSGQAIILRLGFENDTSITPIAGGQGGKGGRNFKTAALKSLSTFKVESHIIDEHIDLSKFKIKTLLSGRCASEVGRMPQNSSAELTNTLKQKTIKMSLGHQLSNDSIMLELLNDGTDLPKSTSEFAPHGRSGLSGKFERRVFADRDEWRSNMPANLIFPD